LIKVHKLFRNSLNQILSDGFKRYYKNTSWLVLDQILRTLVGFFLGIYIARYFGPDKFGVYSYVLSISVILSSFSKLGLDSLIVKELILSSENKLEILGTSFWLKIFGALTSYLFLLFIIIILNDKNVIKLYMCIISIGTFFIAFEVIDYYFQSIVQSKFVSISRILQLIITSAIRIFLIYYNFELKYFILTTLFEQIFLAAALAFAFSRKNNQQFYRFFDKKMATNLLNKAKPYIFSGIIIAIYTNVDKLFLSKLIDKREVGIYSSAVSLVSALNVIPYILSNSFFPALVNAKERSEILYKSRLILLTRYLLLFSIIFCLIVSLFSKEIIYISFGQKYIASSRVLSIYIWNFVLISFSAIFSKFILAEGIQSVLTINTLIAVLINIAGNYYLIPIYSSRGAAFASLAAQFFPIIFLVISNKKIYLYIKSIFTITNKT